MLMQNALSTSMYRLKRFFKQSFVVIYITIFVLFFQKCIFTHEHSETPKKGNDLFIEAYEALDRAEYIKSFVILKHCVHYDIRCLTLIGVFYYLGLKPVERDAVNALYAWKISSDYGSSDAQFYLAIMYSNYFSLPNLYSYYVDENEELDKIEEKKIEGIQKNVILLRSYIFLTAKYLKSILASNLVGKYKENGVPAENNNFQRVPKIYFTTDNRMIIRIKNIRYNIGELEAYFNNLENFPFVDHYKTIKNKKIYYGSNFGLSLLYYYSSSLANHPGSILALGNRYMHGNGVDESCETASKLFIRLTNEILNSSSDDNMKFESIDLIKLSIPHYDKYNVNNKKIKNIEMFLESSLHNNHAILTMIARRYLTGSDGVDKNYKKARMYLLKAEKFNNSEAISLLGYIYILGLGVKKDYNKALNYFIKGKKLNDPLSYNGLGYMHFFELGPMKKYIESGKKKINQELAFYYFDLAAKNNLSVAQFNLGCLYLSGVGTVQSFQNAFYWFYKASNNGNILAAYMIGFMNYNGIIVSHNCNMALSLLSKVAEKNSFILNTTKRIIKYNETGRNLEAMFLMAQLAETGNVQAQVNLAHSMSNSDVSLFLPTNSKSKYIYSSRYLSMAADSHHLKSVFTLGDYAYSGDGLYIYVIQKNNLQYNKLYDLGNTECLYNSVGGADRECFINKNKNSLGRKTTNSDELNMDDKKIISTDFADEQGIIFNDNWRFRYTYRFVFNQIDYELAYKHYRAIISYYPNNPYAIQTISRACYNLGFMHYYGIGVAKNIDKSLIYFNSSIKIYSTHKIPSTLLIFYIKMNTYLYKIKKQFNNLKKLWSL
ncbi:ubiquitin-protein ligase, putative [Plasmodium chabaudi chabaudi]|uniref:Ubiquitin-protein ligase, putative n=1 Tax=Plasmodium chabaudi chabaudi TaxID=31271 RepID=A0A4V0KBH9_PLACU|nr:ubiquitin-protein ligase, putative [Plasmodium chabaudi chabaudi]VTZ70105.1 ubiquitin-protein ligase, putative [Plasmodium chabaudi chabaudi]|eukprot:XP_737001.2 ubiquitin-protein ligase, putative [Plasmodium chabaudi chabaudi]